MVQRVGALDNEELLHRDCNKISAQNANDANELSKFIEELQEENLAFTHLRTWINNHSLVIASTMQIY